jgi:hypothetical protein
VLEVQGGAGLSGEAGTQLIRGTHPYVFRSGRWARLVGTVDDPETGRRCYSVMFADGATDWWPVQDAAAGYQFCGLDQVAKAVNEVGAALCQALKPVVDWAARMLHDLHRVFFPKRHGRCWTCHPRRKPKPLAVDGHAYQRRLRNRRKRRRR